MRIIKLMILLGILCALSPVIANAQEWEYLTIGYIDALYEESLKIAGENGWELVSSRRVMIGKEESRMAATEAIFKRQKNLHSKFKTIEQTKNIIEEIHTNYVKELYAEKLAEIEKMKKETIRKLNEMLSKYAKLDSLKDRETGDMVFGFKGKDDILSAYIRLLEDNEYISASLLNKFKESLPKTIKSPYAYKLVTAEHVSTRTSNSFLYVKTKITNLTGFELKRIIVSCYILKEGDNVPIVRVENKNVTKQGALDKNSILVYEFVGSKPKSQISSVKYIVEEVSLSE